MSALQQHAASVQAGVVTRRTVTGLRNALNSAWRARRGYTVSRTALRVCPQQLDLLQQRLTLRRPVVRGSLHASGVAVLQNPRYRKRWTAQQGAVIAGLKQFRLMGFMPVGRGAHCTPVYWAEDDRGGGFAFYNLSWQAGGKGPQVVDPATVQLEMY